MELLIALFERYGAPLVVGAVLLEQVGPPIPSGPLLVVAGALATERGRISTFHRCGGMGCEHAREGRLVRRRHTLRKAGRARVMQARRNA